MRAVTAVLLAFAVTVGAAGCGGDDSGDPKAAEEYAIDVEENTDEVRGEANNALRELNLLAQDSRRADRTVTALQLAAVDVNQTETVLHALTPPAAAETSSADLGFAIGDLARNLDSVATDIRIAARTGDEGDAARAGSRLILANSSAVSALSRAVRSLATEAAD